MRIQNNIMAINTHRQYTMNNAGVEKSAEKLSSGYRINRAADDAAGLAISEKMRSQIKGLNMAARNSQDAASLIQTAEGALQEVHSMLQRMNELAVQSATGTNETFDRTQIAKEFEQLKREINDISEQTNFNNMKILDGSLSAEGLQRTAYTSGVYRTYEEGSLEYAVAQTSHITGVTGVAGTLGAFTLDVSGFSVNAYGNAGDTVEIDLSQFGSGEKLIIDVSDRFIDGSQIAQGNNSGEALLKNNEQLNTDKVKLNGEMYNIRLNNGRLTFEQATAKDNDMLDFSGVYIGTSNLSSITVTNANGANTASISTTVTAGATMVEATHDTTQYSIDTSKLREGDTVKIGGSVWTFTYGTQNLASNMININSAQRDLSSFIADVNSYLTATYGNTGVGGVTASLIGNRNDLIEIRATGTGGANAGTTMMLQFSPAYNGGTTTLELDVNKMVDGDRITFMGETATYRTGQTAEDIAKNLGLYENLVGETITVAGEHDAYFDKSFDQTKYGSMKIQVGAQENEQLSIKIKAMNTAGLGLDNATIATQELAGNAITSVRNAVNEVSDQRALLGAMQNRMDYKINNIKIQSENLAAAESRIRDVDIASEMTTFTKFNILSQASTAMLAQANSAPQNVLSLLR